MGGGDFSAEAYKQLRDAYDREQQRQVDDEIKGTTLMGQEYGLETLPVDSPWKDKIENWTYPSGKSQFMDEKQNPDEILQIMRDAAQERIDASKKDEVKAEGEESEENEDVSEEDTDGIAEMSDEEFDTYVAKLVEEDLEEEIANDGEEKDEEDEDKSDEEDVAVEEEQEEESDEEEAEDEDDTVEADDSGDAEEADEEVESEEDGDDPEDIAAQIAELRAELESMQFVTLPEESEDDES